MGYKMCKEGHLMDSSWKYCPVCLAPLAGWLVYIDEQSRYRQFYTFHVGKSTVGSGLDCEVRIDGFNLSRKQASIVVSDKECTVVDLSGTNSMKVNNIPTPRTVVIDGDVIDFNGTVFKIKLIGN